MYWVDLSHSSSVPFAGLLLLLLWSACISMAQTSSSVEEEAYEHHRAGLLNMSMARFEEAIGDFRKAAALLSDYQIRGRPLVYTPIFMMAWAYEKLGRFREACGYYQRFLEISPTGLIEPTKALHAREVLDQECE